MMAPALARIGSTSSDFFESNTSQTVSPRRNDAAGVALAKENVRRSPSLSRTASTAAPVASTGLASAGFISAGFISAGLGSDGGTAAGVILLDASSAAAGASFAGDPEDGRSAETCWGCEAGEAGGSEDADPEDEESDFCASGSATGVVACS